MNVPAIEVSHLAFAYENHPVLEEVTWQVAQGAFIGMVGPNGGGKSTLLKLLLGLLPAPEGKIRVLGKAPVQARTNVGYLPQFMTLKAAFPMSVQEVVLSGRLSNRHLFGRFNAKDRELAAWALEASATAALAGKRFADLSGGQRQRVLLARALAKDPKLLLLDEPTSNVDTPSEENLFDLLKTLNKEKGLTVVVVSHDVGFISAYATEAACVNKRLVVHPASGLTEEKLAGIYGVPVQAVHHHHVAGEEHHH